jgi:hypothetical protein
MRRRALTGGDYFAGESCVCVSSRRMQKSEEMIEAIVGMSEHLAQRNGLKGKKERAERLKEGVTGGRDRREGPEGETGGYYSAVWAVASQVLL